MSASRKSAPVRFGSLTARTPLALPGQRIGLLGGSFNPPHAAHVLLTRIAMARLGLDRVWWIVTPGNPLKEHDGLASLDDRVAACRVLAPAARVAITTFESALPTAYTAATLAFLTRRYPRTRFVWLMGADNLASFHRWQHWREIAGMMPIAVVDRPGQRFRAVSGPAARALSRWRITDAEARRLADLDAPRWVLLGGPRSSLSSTAIRARGSWPKRHD